jgi:hypothetical protein
MRVCVRFEKRLAELLKELEWEAQMDEDIRVRIEYVEMS